VTVARRASLTGFLTLALTAIAVAAIGTGGTGAPAPFVASADTTTPSPAEVRAPTRRRMRIEVPPTAVEVSPAATAAPRVRPTTVRNTRYTRPDVAAPRSVQVIPVPVPAELAPTPVEFAITRTGDADLISARSGTVPAAEGPRSAILVTRVPASAEAGELDVARVEFFDGSTAVSVDVELVVARVRRILMRPTHAGTALYPGRRTSLTYVVQNLGNAPDTVLVGADEATGWQLSRPVQVILERGEERTLTLAVRTPPPPASGTFPIRVRARSGAQELAALSLPIELLPDPREARSLSGPTLVAGVASSTGAATGSSPVIGLMIEGPVSERLRVRGRTVLPTDREDYNAFAMGRVGYFLHSSFLNVSGSKWSVTGGRTGSTFSPVFGWNVYGLGATGELTQGTTTFGATLLQERFDGVSGGNSVGFNASRPLNSGRLTFSAVRLRQELLVDRGLDAGGLTYAVTPRAGLDLRFEGGYRRADHASGPTASAEVRNQGPRGTFQLYAAHAPGGSGAFARASDELNLSATRRVNDRLSLRGYAFGAGDSPTPGATSSSRGIAGGPAVRVGKVSIVDLDLSSRVSDFDGQAGGFGSREMMATVGVRTTMFGVNGNFSVGSGQLTRTTEFDGGTAFERTGGRMVARGGLDAQTRIAMLSLTAGHERNDAATGQIPSQTFVALAASGIRPVSGQYAPILDAGVWMSRSAGSVDRGAGVRVGAEFPLPGRFSLTIDAERNPYLSGTGAPTWVTVFRLDRTIGLPGLHRPTARGRVFDDRNANGIQDSDEPGLGGLLVRHGGGSMLTANDGSYRFYDRVGPNQVPTVDAGSLPIGQLAVSRPASAPSEWDLPVIRTARLNVALVATPDSIGRAPLTRPSDIAVLAADSTGAVWIVRADSSGLATFDALPPGRYTVTLDFSGTRERLRQLENAVELKVIPGEALPVVRIPYGFRAVRLFDGGAAAGGGARRR
jgi:hypothetical protein